MAQMAQFVQVLEGAAALGFETTGGANGTN